jgi:uncharacterized protein (DUF58 family)
MSQSPLLDPAVIQRAEVLGLESRKIVEGFLAGAHPSPLHGMAVEFAQHREYAPGDDLRHLDYKVLGRTDHYFLKQYEQETDFTAHILLDGSASMRYGSAGVTKFDYARQMAATLAYLILLQRDAVGVSVFDTATRTRQPRTGNLGRMGDILTALAAFEPVGKTDVAATLHSVAAELTRKGIVILISDLFDDEEAILGGIQHLLFGGHEVIVFHVMDPAEINLPFSGSIEFAGLETGLRVQTEPAAIRTSYRAEVDAFRDRIRLACQRAGCHCIFTDTSRPWAEVLGAYLAARRHGGA